jgi:hypothetical protein
MNDPVEHYDLVVMVADNDMEQTIKALLNRHSSLRIREINTEYLRHPQRDGGCRVDAIELLRLYLTKAHYAIVIFDLEGSGEADCNATTLELQLEERLNRNGWDERGGVIVIDPELERWIWASSDEIPRAIEHQCSYTELLQILSSNGFQFDGDDKPVRPKEAFQMLLERANISRSSAIYYKLASRVSTRRCSDRAFEKFISLLRQWFPRD